MLFNSGAFLLFFPIVIILFFSINVKLRNLVLLMASYYFYMCWKTEYIILILLSTVVDYYAAIYMSRESSKRRKNYWLILSLVVNLGLLFFFKYFELFSESIRVMFTQINVFYDSPVFNLLLPVGISFYTFQTLAYSIDVYNGKIDPERNFTDFALYVSFFPQLVAGPIERAGRLLPQFKHSHLINFDLHRAAGGLQLIIWGFFKKLVIADRLAPLVNEIYNAPGDASPISLLTATYLFAFQIYCDFSGYSDIAIGTARVLGYDLMDNFKVPYLSKSIREFWKRWHISLSSWFRDYLYIPLGGNRVPVSRWYFNLVIVFLVSGLWHGANWTFVLWGGIHGLYLVLELLLRGHVPSMKLSPGIKKLGSIFLTFHLVLLAWIFFRANSIGDAFLILGKIASIPTELSISGLINGLFWQPSKGIMMVSYLLLVGFILVDPIMDTWLKRVKANQLVPKGRYIFAVISAIIVLFGFFGQIEFIYFQF